MGAIIYAIYNTDGSCHCNPYTQVSTKYVYLDTSLHTDMVRKVNLILKYTHIIRTYMCVCVVSCVCVYVCVLTLETDYELRK